jgi:uncharacterized protein (UPF0332 family)
MLKDTIRDIAVSRAYYAVYQRIKDYLDSKDFDYQTFLDGIGEIEDRRDFSHKTIDKALVECAKTYNPLEDTSKSIYIGSLKKRRLTADYDDASVTCEDLKASVKEAKYVLDLVQRLKGDQ